MVTAVFPATATAAADTTISVAAIAGVTAPVTGDAPVTATTAGTGYTGSVSWSTSPDTFAAATSYTATITLTATSGYTLTGVIANFFTVADATTVINSADSGVVTAVFPATATAAATTCDGTSTCQVGDIGPGGGTIFYVATDTFIQSGATGSMCTSSCKYLEVAPSNWNGEGNTTEPWADQDHPDFDFVSITNDEAASQNGVGLGYFNSSAIVALTGPYNASTKNYAAGAARAYTGGSKTDWYLPTTAELNLLCQWNHGIAPDVSSACSGGELNSATYGAGLSGFVNQYYWSSSETVAGAAWSQYFADGSQGGAGKYVHGYVRPVRAFGPPPPSPSS